jgi:glucose-6-phosphate isomerase
MIITKNIFFKNFKKKINNVTVKKKLKYLIQSKNEVIESLTTRYSYSYSKKKINKLKKSFSSIQLIGMGGSILGTKAIYNFLNHKVKKKIHFFDNLVPKLKKDKRSGKVLNLIISKSGNTLETILNTNLLIKKNDKNIFLTQKKQNYLRNLAEKMKAEIIDHNNFIGGRYSVLSEVGMLPASLVGLNEKKFKQFNNLVKNKKFINSLVNNVSNIVLFLKKKKFNSIIINYDENSGDFFRWYQQLVGESLGKKQKGIFPFISTMPKDNHSLMQLYLDGPKKNFFTFFNVKNKSSDAIIKNSILNSHNYLNNKKLDVILNAQKRATEDIFNKKKIPFRSFEILNRNEEALGELFSFFILETILIGKILSIDPYNQPAVEDIKVNTKKILINS